MNDKRVEIVWVVDRTRNMIGVRPSIVPALNKVYMSHVLAPGSADVSLYTYTDEVRATTPRCNVSSARHLAMRNYILREKQVALWDAIAMAVDTTGRALTETPEENRPTSVTVCILAGGPDNASVNETPESVAERIRVQQDVYKWNFLCCAPQSMQEELTEKLGFLPENVSAWDPTARLSASRSIRAMSLRVLAERMKLSGKNVPQKFSRFLSMPLSQIIEIGAR